MSKSLGNLITIKEALERYSADAIRIFALSSHYRSPLTYSEEILEAAERGAERLRQAVNNIISGNKAVKKIGIEHYRKRFTEAMDDDFNTAQALASLFDLAREINKYDSEGIEAGEARAFLMHLGETLGLTFKEPERPPLNTEALRQIAGSITERLEKAGQSQLSKDFRTKATIFSLGSNTESLLELFISTREQLREAKQWQQADMVRAELDEAGITLEDTPKGTVWKRKR